MGKTRDLFKKIRDTKGTLHAKMVSIKNKWQEYTEELYKKDLHDQDNLEGVITHTQPRAGHPAM